jgi:aquaporin related protein
MAHARNILPSHKKDVSKNAGLHGGDTTNGNANHHQKHLHNRTWTQKWRNELVAMAAEFAGTFMFMFFAYGGTQVANSAAVADNASTEGQQNDSNSITQVPNTSVLLYISLVFGFSLMVNVWVFFRVSGGLFNPAVSDSPWKVKTEISGMVMAEMDCMLTTQTQVTLGLYLIGAIRHTRAILCFISQMLAGIASAAVVSAILPGPLNVSTTLGAGVSPAQGVFLEMFLTSLLVFTIFMLAAEKHKATFLAPVGIGLALFVAELVGVFFTGGSLNPARSFGPCVVTRQFPNYHYIYWFGPLMGTLLAWGMYKIVKSVEYETVNPGQDFDDHEVMRSHISHPFHLYYKSPKLTLCQAALFHPPNDPDSADQVERPNVAAIVAEQAVRLASRSSSGGSTGDQMDGIEGRMSPERGSPPVASRLQNYEGAGQAHGVRQ